jgi:AraC family transcriptional activator of pyochelin receptor
MGRADPIEHLDTDEPSFERIVVTDEMTVLVGAGAMPPGPAPEDAAAITIDLSGAAPAMLALDLAPDLSRVCDDARLRLVLLVSQGLLARMGGEALLAKRRAAFHLPAELRAVAAALRDAPAGALTRTAYRGAKAIELICRLIELSGAGELVPVAATGALSLADSRRILQARRLIDERSAEKLTLDAIARACGLNRAKLSAGFREMFRCTVAEAIAEQRLTRAETLLLTTDLPVSLVGYEAGYLNNASFARAFGRYFGRTPSDYRARRLAS